MQLVKVVVVVAVEACTEIWGAGVRVEEFFHASMVLLGSDEACTGGAALDLRGGSSQRPSGYGGEQISFEYSLCIA